uniref:hypothetical protein n=1 Tax=Winogradskyella sp. 4-2091 TaxID=3381659 RepID=UPI003891FE5D
MKDNFDNIFIYEIPRDINDCKKEELHNVFTLCDSEGTIINYQIEETKIPKINLDISVEKVEYINEYPIRRLEWDISRILNWLLIQTYELDWVYTYRFILEELNNHGYYLSIFNMSNETKLYGIVKNRNLVS